MQGQLGTKSKVKARQWERLRNGCEKFKSRHEVCEKGRKFVCKSEKSFDFRSREKSRQKEAIVYKMIAVGEKRVWRNFMRKHETNEKLKSNLQLVICLYGLVV